MDGPLSNKCYLSALDKCYQLFCKKASKKGVKTTTTTLSSFDALLFHTPYCKLVKKSVARLALNDFLRLPRDEVRKIGTKRGAESSHFSFPFSAAAQDNIPQSHHLLMSPSKPPTRTKVSRELSWNVLQISSERKPSGA